MKTSSGKTNFNLGKLVKKLSLSAFVVVSFILYALQRPGGGDKLGQAAAPVTGGSLPSQTDTPMADTSAGSSGGSGVLASPTDTAAAPTATPAAQQQVISPTATSPAATSTPAVAAKNGQYKDGTYTGPEVDATYGLVQVQAVVQNGKIANVQFLEFPNDRRTSIRINSYAVPYLQQEAVQVQSANVDWITGATLTSEAFQMSLQAALAKAKG